MNKIKRALVLMLTILMIASAAMGCSNNSDSVDERTGGNSGAAGSESTAVAQEEPMKILWYIDENSVWDPSALIVADIEQMFNVKLEPVARPGQDQSKWYTLKLSSGERFDYITSGGLNFKSYQSFIDQGIIMEVKPEMISENMPNYMEWTQRYKDLYGGDLFKWWKRDGKLYSIPQARPDDATRNVIGYRKDWLEKVGRTVPETLDDVEAVLKAFTFEDPDGNNKDDTYGYSTVDWLQFGLSPFTGAYGTQIGIWFNDNGTLKYGSIQPGIKDALALLAKWYKAGYIDPESLMTGDFAILKNKVCSSKAGSTTMFYGDLLQPETGWFYADLRKINPKAEWAISTGPKGPNGDRGCLQFNPVTYAGIMFYKDMDSQPERVKKYMQIFDALAFDENWRTEAQWGKENETFIRDASGGFAWKAPYDNPNDAQKKELAEKYGLLTGAASFISTDIVAFFSDPVLNRKLNFTLANAKLDEYGASLAKGKYNLMSQSPVTRPIWDKYKEALNTLERTFISSVITGKIPASDFDKFVEEWKQKGGNEVIKESQEIFDKYLK